MWDVRASFLPAIYFEGVGLAGGISVLLPPQPVDAAIAERVLDGLDGLIVTGGRDVDPAAYGQRAAPRDRRRRRRQPIARRVGIRAARAAPSAVACRSWASAAARRCSTSHSAAPCTSICPTSSAIPTHQQGNAVFSTSSIRTVPGTRLAALIGESSDAQCYHHQAIDRLGDGLIVSAQDADGVIEAVEIARSTDFLLGGAVASRGDGWTICGCSPRWSKRPRRMRRERVTA